MQSRSISILAVVALVLAMATPAFAVRTTLTPVVPLGPHPTLPVAANALDLTFTAADATNSNQFVLNGRFLILVRNVHASSPFTFTLTSAPDTRKRTGDVGAFTMQAGEVAAFYIDNHEGWRQTDGYFYLTANDTNIQFCIVRLP